MNLLISSSPVEKFDLGTIYIGTIAKVQLDYNDIYIALRRHVQGDWGDVYGESHAINDKIAKEGGYLLSVYHDSRSVKFLIDTNLGGILRTRVIMPEEY